MMTAWILRCPGSVTRCPGSVTRTLNAGDELSIGRADLPPAYGVHSCSKPGCTSNHVSRVQCSLRCTVDGIEIVSRGVNETGIASERGRITFLSRGSSLLVRARCSVILDSRSAASSTLELLPADANGGGRAAPQAQAQAQHKRKRNEHDSEWEDSEAEGEDGPLGVARCGNPPASASLAIGSVTHSLQPHSFPRNARFAEAFEELARNKKAASGSYRSGDDVDRSVRAYEKQAKQLRLLPFELSDVSQLDGLDGFGKASKGRLKVAELLRTGELQRLEVQRSDEAIGVKAALCQVHGVSGATADEW